MRTRLRVIVGPRGMAGLLVLAVAVPEARAQVASEAGWTVATFALVDTPANGIELDCWTGDLYVASMQGSEVLSLSAAGVATHFALAPYPDELAINRRATRLFVKRHDFGGAIFMLDGDGSPRGSFPVTGFPTGIAFDSAGNFYAVQSADSGIITKYPAWTLPPNRPAGVDYATGVTTTGIEGMTFDCADRLFVTEDRSGTVKQVVPPAGPHVTWASGLRGPHDVAFDPCTGDLFITEYGPGNVVRCPSAGTCTTFASGLRTPVGIGFDSSGNVYVGEFDGGRIVKFTTPAPCAGNCGCSAPVAGLPGAVPNGGDRPGVPLTVRKAPASDDVVLAWSLSCSADAIECAVYEGRIGAWYSHDAVLCTTSGALVTATVTPGVEGRYFLVVPLTSIAEGSYGVNSFGGERPPSDMACFEQLLGCP